MDRTTSARSIGDTYFAATALTKFFQSGCLFYMFACVIYAKGRWNFIVIFSRPSSSFYFFICYIFFYNFTLVRLIYIVDCCMFYFCFLFLTYESSDYQNILSKTTCLESRIKGLFVLLTFFTD